MTVVLPASSLSPWQWLYGGAHQLRRAWLSRRARRLPRPVISVGNLHWGGGGKTPLVGAVAAHLRDSGLRVAILSRGYGSKGKGVRVLSRGEGPLLGPRSAGDEPVLLAGQLLGVSVVVCPDRHLAGRHALQRLDPQPQVFLLDDGFQHLRLHRDLDLLVFPAADPFAGGRLPPAGRLREPLNGAARADAVVLTGARDDQPAGQRGAGEQLASALRPHGFDGPGFISRTRAAEPRRIDQGELRHGSRVVAVSGIARPETILAIARQAGFEILEHVVFPDHHPYPDASIRKILEAFRRRDAELVLTTGKDRVKLQSRLEVPLAEIPIRAEPEPRFFAWLDRRLAEIRDG